MSTLYAAALPNMSRVLTHCGTLEAGERVIVSSYEPFGDVERLELN